MKCNKFAALFFLSLICIFCLSSACLAEELSVKYSVDYADVVLLGDARYDKDIYILTDEKYWQSGSVWLSKPISGDEFAFSCDFYTGHADHNSRIADGYGGADGITVAFFANSVDGKDGYGIGFNGCGGYGVEIDTYYNSSLNDPRDNHIAIINGDVSAHMQIANAQAFTEDGKWHTIYVEYLNGVCRVLVDGAEVLISDGIKPNGKFRIGVTAATGSGCNYHAVKNIRFSTHGMPGFEGIVSGESENPIKLVFDSFRSDGRLKAHWTPNSRCDYYIVLLNDKARNETLNSLQTETTDYVYYLRDFNCETKYLIWVGEYVNHEGFNGFSDEVAFTVSEHVYGQNGICLNCWHDVNGNYHRPNYQMLNDILPSGNFPEEVFIPNGDLPEEVFNPRKIKHMYYLRSVYDWSHTALLLVDENDHGFHLSYYGDGSNSNNAYTDIGIAYMRSYELEYFYINGAVLDQVTSSDRTTSYYTYYDMIDIIGLFPNVDSRYDVYLRGLEVFKIAIDDGIDYDWYSRNCDDIAHWVFFEEFSDPIIPAETFQILWQRVKNFGGVYKSVMNPPEHALRVKSSIVSFIPIE